VVATTDVMCYKLDRASFAEAVQRRPELAEQISHLLARRKIELDAARAGLAAEMTNQRVTDTQNDLLRRIRDFFRLE
jgi:CRP-like cAMP-binding protein